MRIDTRFDTGDIGYITNSADWDPEAVYKTPNGKRVKATSEDSWSGTTENAPILFNNDVKDYQASARADLAAAGKTTLKAIPYLFAVNAFKMTTSYAEIAFRGARERFGHGVIGTAVGAVGGFFAGIGGFLYGLAGGLVLDFAKAYLSIVGIPVNIGRAVGNYFHTPVEPIRYTAMLRAPQNAFSPMPPAPKKA